MKKRTLKGFTLIEIIVVIAILGILMAILVPSAIGYIKKSRKTHDMSNGKYIAEEVVGVISSKSEASKSFYHSSPQTQSPQWNKTDPVSGESYYLIPVAVVNGGPGCTGDYTVWTPYENENQKFADLLNAEMVDSNGEVDIDIKYQPDDSSKDLNRWFICYRNDKASEIEIWVGNGSSQSWGKGEPMYRVYPKPAY